MIVSIVFVVTLVLIDQVTKFIAQNELANDISFEFIPNIINFTYVENTGAAFGIFKGNSFLLSLVSLFLSCVIIYVIINKKKFFQCNYIEVYLLLVLAGAIGNFIDRFFRHYVIDFIDLAFVNFAVFNLADTYVVIGSSILCFISLFLEDDKDKIKSKEH